MSETDLSQDSEIERASPAEQDARSEDNTEQSPKELFDKNMAALAELEPTLHAQLVNHKPLSRLTFDDDGSANVAYEDFNLYPEGQEKYVSDQLEAYNSHSVRLNMGHLGDGGGLDIHSKDVYDKLTERMDESGFKFTHMPYRENSYFTIILGIGLGGHIDDIVARTGCRVLIFVEPNLDFIYHSLSVYDWSDLFDRFKERGVIHFFRDNDPEFLSTQIKTIFRAHNPMSLDGTVVFQHYQGAIFQEIHKTMQESLRTAVMGLGFYQDEINMIGQTYKNLEQGKARVIRRLNAHPGLPAFIVATGPSLDKLLPFIKENRDKVVLFSCGTSLHVLMKNGITPDFWVITERNYGTYEVIRDANDEFDISPIRFAGSTTVFPKMPELFKEAIYFFRPGLSVAPLFSRESDQIASIPDPLAANAGLSFALHVGFREIYFLGVDTGSKKQGRSHAMGTWYERHVKDGQMITDMDLPVPGNFGGTVWTIPVYQWSRENLELLIERQAGRVFYNLGDGALIKGAVPLHPKAAKLKTPEVDKQELITRFIESCPKYSVDDFDQSWEKAAIIDNLPDYCQRLKDAVENDENGDDFAFIKDTVEILRPAEAGDPIAMLLRGTLFTVITVYEYYANRAVDEEERATMFTIFKEEYAGLVDHLRDRAIEIFSGLEEGEPWEEEFSR